MQFNKHLSLRQRATVSIATSFWKNKEVKSKVSEWFKSCNGFKIHEAEKKWDEFTKTIISEWNRDLIPQQLDIDLIYIVKMISKTIFNWFQYIKHEYKIQEVTNLIAKIHWTPYGTVDAVMTFKLHWLNNPNLDITQIYKFACNHMIEDDIDDLWNKIPSNIQCYLSSHALVSFDRHLVAYWKHHRDGNLPNLIRSFRSAADPSNGEYRLEFNFIYEPNRSTEENMLRLSAYQGYFSAVNYFWEKLTEEEQNESVVKCARIALLSCHHYYREHLCIEHYKINEYIEICIFLMNQMTDDHKKALFNEKLNPLAVRFKGFFVADAKDEILQMLLTGWPWQEFFIPVLEDMIRLLDDDSFMFCYFLDSITKKMSDDYLPGYSTEMSNYRSLLRKAWSIIPASIKQNLVKIGKRHHFISDLIDIGDFNSLKLIFNDPEIAAIRNKYINFGRCTYNKLIMSNKFEKIDQFLREIFKSEEEIKDFKKSIDLLHTFMFYHDYHSADKFLDWVCSTPEEKESKKKMEFEKIFDSLICVHDVKVLDKFFNWTFVIEEEKNVLKNHFKSGMQPMIWVLRIWIKNEKNVTKAKEESTEFLQWLLEPEEDIERFKRELFSDHERNLMNRVIFARLHRVGDMMELLSWCSCPDEEIRRIELAIRIKLGTVK